MNMQFSLCTNASNKSCVLILANAYVYMGVNVWFRNMYSRHCQALIKFLTQVVRRHFSRRDVWGSAYFQSFSIGVVCNFRD